MPRQTQNQGGQIRGRVKRRWPGRVLKVALLFLAALLVAMILEAMVIRLRFVDVYLDDLPAEFNGTTVLFMTDLHMDPLNSPERAYRVMEQLSRLNPDMILLGGDYASAGLFEAIGEEDAQSRIRARKEEDLGRFFSWMKGLNPPLGKYAVAGEHDVELEELQGILALGDVRLLKNECVRVERNGASLVVMGLDDWIAGEQNPGAPAAQVVQGDCVVALSHNPDAFPAMILKSAAGGGSAVDLMLSGHTHGGQITLFGIRPIYTYSTYGNRYAGGWIREGGPHLLVSCGVGTTLMPLRLGATAEAHLITLYAHPNPSAD